MKIPIKNLFYMLAYAWDMVEDLEEAFHEAEDMETPQDLLARLLSLGLQAIIKKGFERTYRSNEDETYRPSGKVSLQDSIHRAHRLAGRLVVDQDEYSMDCLSNQILLFALQALIKDKRVELQERERLTRYVRLFKGVTVRKISKNDLAAMRFHRNNQHYRFPIQVARLIVRNELFNSRKGSDTSTDFLNEKELWRVFEKFIRNYYRREQCRYTVRSARIAWQKMSGEPASLDLVPQLHPDVLLESEGHLLILDTKFYKTALDSHRKDTIKASHIYQLFAYVKNFESLTKKQIDGIMVYPTVERHLDVSLLLESSRFEFRTLDLSKDWRSVRTRLDEILNGFL